MLHPGGHTSSAGNVVVDVHRFFHTTDLPLPSQFYHAKEIRRFLHDGDDAECLWRLPSALPNETFVADSESKIGTQAIG